MVKDPVCLMEIEPRSAASVAVIEGRCFYFCSDKCRNKFNDHPAQYRDKVTGIRLTIGVMGSANRDTTSSVSAMAFGLGQSIAKRGFVLISGACPGLPYDCASGARAEGGLSVGISPALSLDEHVHKYHSPSDVYDVLIYTGSGLMGREVTNIRSSDIVVILGGRSGTLGEFAIAYDEGKLIGVLDGSGGITEHIPAIVAGFDDKETGARILYESNPETLITNLVEAYITDHYKKPSCFCDGVMPADG